MTAARRARNERRAAARQAEGIERPSLARDPAIAARRAITGLLLRGIVLIILMAAGVLLTYGAYSMSPYSQASLPILTRAMIAYAVLAGVYAWHVQTATRYLPLAVAAVAGAVLLTYLWQVGSSPW